MKKTSGRDIQALTVITTSAVVVFASAFFTWMTVENPVGKIIHLPGTMTMTITGWNGSMTLIGMSIPHWVVVFAALLPLLLVLLRQFQLLELPAFVLYLLAGYGLFHSGATSVMTVLSTRATPGAGPFLSSIGFAGLIFGLYQYYSDEK